MNLIIESATKFFNYLHVFGYINGDTVKHATFGDSIARIDFGNRHDNGFQEFRLSFLIDFEPDLHERLRIFGMGGIFEEPLKSIIDRIKRSSPSSLFDRWKGIVGVSGDDTKQKFVLDVGGRARSGVLAASDFPDWTVTVLDIVPDEGVDIVGDAHRMSEFVDKGSFDGVMSISVFEHLLMPWKAVVEMAKVLKVGGHAFVHTHQTIGMHDAPWDFWRFSDTAWKGLFNQYTGFRIIETQMDEYLHIVPRTYHPVHANAEFAGGFLSSAVLAVKIGEPVLDWDASLDAIVTDSYPLHLETGAVERRKILNEW
jgi:hypothetical protein